MSSKNKPTPEALQGLNKRLTETKSIAEAWAIYEALILDPVGAGDVQRREMRRAFYSGVDWSLKCVLNASADEQAGETLFSTFMRESAEFAAALRRGEV